jgi:hypothetical protein
MKPASTTSKKNKPVIKRAILDILLLYIELQ